MNDGEMSWLERALSRQLNLLLLNLFPVYFRIVFIVDPVFAEIRAEINEEMTNLEKNVLVIKEKLAPRTLNNEKRVKFTKMLWVAEHQLVGLKNELLELQKRQL